MCASIEAWVPSAPHPPPNTITAGPRFFARSSARAGLDGARGGGSVGRAVEAFARSRRLGFAIVPRPLVLPELVGSLRALVFPPQGREPIFGELELTLQDLIELMVAGGALRRA